MGKHIPGVPISWLRFWVFICLENDYEADEVVWRVMPGEPTYDDELSAAYKDKMKKLVDNVKALDILRKKVRSESGVVSASRFNKKSHHKKHHKAHHKKHRKQMKTTMWKTNK